MSRDAQTAVVESTASGIGAFEIGRLARYHRHSRDVPHVSRLVRQEGGQMASTDETGKPYDLDGQIDVLIQEYSDDRETHWASRTDGADWDIQKRLYGHAEAI